MPATNSKVTEQTSSQKEIRRQLAEKKFAALYDDWEQIKLEKRLKELELKEHNLQNSIANISNSQELEQKTSSAIMAKPALKKIKSAPLSHTPKPPIVNSNTAPQEKVSSKNFLKKGSANLASNANKFVAKKTNGKVKEEYFSPSQLADKFVRNLRK